MQEQTCEICGTCCKCCCNCTCSYDSWSNWCVSLWCKWCVCYDELTKFNEGYQDMDAENSVITEQPSAQKCNFSTNKVIQKSPSTDYEDDIINEYSITQRFGHTTDYRMQMLISKAIYFTNKAEENGERELLKNSSLHIYENENFYRQTSGNGKNLIIVNFENEDVVVESIGFKC
ncbi:unnamed protein product [Mytilus coruscus]|uniref:Uncharacterized protein n=1 Tax=Mytilus coruscus TaxID=42192 RepID=A0A6J8A6R3_MYTCO|nr:unnamed protein product [Mytilus coruscus]